MQVYVDIFYIVCTLHKRVSVIALLSYQDLLLLLQLEACAHPFFDELREPNARLPNNRPLPPLFNFKQEVHIRILSICAEYACPLVIRFKMMSVWIFNVQIQRPIINICLYVSMSNLGESQSFSVPANAWIGHCFLDCQLLTIFVGLAITVHFVQGREGGGELLNGSYQLSQWPAVVCLIVHGPFVPFRRFMMFVLIFYHVIESNY